MGIRTIVAKQVVANLRTKGEIVPVSLVMRVKKSDGKVWERKTIPKNIGEHFVKDAEGTILPEDTGEVVIEYPRTSVRKYVTYVLSQLLFVALAY